MKSENIVVFTTCQSKDEAQAIAGKLVQERLAACVNIVAGVESVYRWKDEIHFDSEFLLVIKSSQALFPKLAAAIRVAHSYEVPELIALPIVAGTEPYLSWLAGELASA